MGRPKSRQRKFNLPRGRHSRKCKTKYAKHASMVQDNLQHLREHMRIVRPKSYQIRKVTHSVNGKSCVRIVVRRMQQPVKMRGIRAPDMSSLKMSCIDEDKISSLDGYRVCAISSLQHYISATTSHAVLCKFATAKIKDDQNAFNIVSETKRCGLVSTLVVKCVCGEEIHLDTSSRETSQKNKYLDVNFRAVWGSMASGNGLTPLNETLATIGIDGISPPMYASIENTIGQMWSSCLDEELLAAAAEERKLAVERGDFHDGVPAITVICDGGWSKRSHRHTYDALGGVAVIFGAATGKLLHVGVRNRHCHVCTLADTRQCTPPSHDCFKNWDNSSQSMESDVIVEGFMQAESKYGLRYMKVIADGDSSTFSKIQESVPVWGKHVTKLECANHACKCLRSNLENLVSNKPHYKGRGKLTKLVRIRLVTAVRCAIRMRSKELAVDRHKATLQLEKDIRNSIHHVFGNHSKCSDFCKSRLQPPTAPVTVSYSGNGSKCDDCDDIVLGQSTYWEEGTAEHDMEESRGDVTYEAMLDSDIIRDVSVLLDRLARKSERLIGNFTTNLAESWMAIRCKFDGGKMVNRCKRGSWHARCFGGALRKNFGPAWSPIVFQQCTSLRPSTAFTNCYRKRSLNLVRSLKCQRKPDVKGRARKRKLKSVSIASTKRAKKEYGPDVEDMVPDVNLTDLDNKCREYERRNVIVNDDQRCRIEECTKQQSLSNRWKLERHHRLTSSTFGEILHKNVNRVVAPLVKRILYPSFRGNEFTRHGLGQETSTIKEYTEFMSEKGEKVSVQKMGLMVDKRHNFLAASTDGKVIYMDGSSSGLIEIKNVLQRNQLTFHEAVRKQSTFCLEIGPSNKLRLKRSHNYYFQCQGQLNIFGMPWIDFVVRRTNPNQLHVERIQRDQSQWENVMVPKLSAFYYKAILPELACPRHDLNPGIREPTKPWFVPLDTVQLKSSGNKRPASTKFKEPSSSDFEPTPGCSTDNTCPRKRSTRKRSNKFVGRKIRHEWVVDEVTKATEWYTGVVLDCVKGKDGEPDADYEVLYDGEKTAYVVNNLQQDLDEGSLKFIDV